ncbi:hypothetical protein [Streptomyces sp. NPDC048650]|uniref:hypothetical protein n=1 Tax=unclassified Streptomyces TaxID=2593676 RepID=UPI003715BD9A
MKHASLKNAAAVTAAALALTVSATGAAHAALTGPAAKAAGATPTTSTGQQTFSSTAVKGNSKATLRITLDAAADGSPVTLTHAEREQFEALAADQAAQSAPASGAKADRGAVSGKKEPATLRCDKDLKERSKHGTLDARFNCKHSVMNWGWKIAPEVRATITSKVHEDGVHWWKNGKPMPKNSAHDVPKDYHLHGTLKTVEHGDIVEFQDHLKFKIKKNGKTGTGTLTWAGRVRAKK